MTFVELDGETGGTGNANLTYERIRRKIVEGQYLPGQRLVEQRLADELQLSRTPVREALYLLEAEGLVTSERNKGAIVRPVTEKDVYDIYELRARMESLAAERAALRSTADDVEALDSAIDDFEGAMMSTAVDSADIDSVRRLQAANWRFHQTLVQMADSAPLQSLLPRSVDIPLVFRALKRFSRREVERSNLFHRLIRDAVANNDPDRAGRLMIEHIFQGRDVVLRDLLPSSGSETDSFTGDL